MLKNTPLVRFIEERLNWTSERQNILSRNISNADSPNYQPQDLKDIDFKALLHRGSGASKIQPMQTSPNHLQSTFQAGGDFKATKIRTPYEIGPDGNAVILEEQMLKMDENRRAHNAAVTVYQNFVKLYKTALSGPPQ